MTIRALTSWRTSQYARECSFAPRSPHYFKAGIISTSTVSKGSAFKLKTIFRARLFQGTTTSTGSVAPALLGPQQIVAICELTLSPKGIFQRTQRTFVFLSAAHFTCANQPSPISLTLRTRPIRRHPFKQLKPLLTLIRGRNSLVPNQRGTTVPIDAKERS